MFVPGMPVPGVELSLAVPQGDGSMVSSAKTDSNGVVAVPYSIGSTPGPVLINATGAGLTTSKGADSAPFSISRGETAQKSAKNSCTAAFSLRNNVAHFRQTA